MHKYTCQPPDYGRLRRVFIKKYFFGELVLLILDDDFILLDRLERAEYLVRADLASARLAAKRAELIAKQLSEQADILRIAQCDILKNAKEEF